MIDEDAENVFDTTARSSSGDGSREPSGYDDRALREIHAWKNPEIGWFGQTMKLINWPLDSTGDLILATPGIGDVIKLSIQGLMSICNDAAHWSIPRESIYEEFRKAGHGTIRTGADIGSLELEQVDRVVAWLDAKYKGLALVQGAGAGAVGLLGIAPDIVALITLNLRAIGEYATYYGFDVSSQEERLFAMNVLGLASSPTDASKALAMAQLVRIAQDVAKKRAWKQLEKHAFVQLIQQIAKSLGIRLTKAKLAQVIPVMGAAVGGGFNAYFTSKVCEAAHYLYRERFLAKKYGAKVIEETVPPAEDIDPGDFTTVAWMPNEPELPKEFTNSIGMRFVLVRPGEFLMGFNEADDEKPLHLVRITQPFYLGVFPVTQAEYQTVTGQNPSLAAGNPRHPVEQVSWDDAVSFAQKLSQLSGEANHELTYRLPSEAEWEFACRAGSTGMWCCEDKESQLGGYCWFDINSGNRTHPVGEKKPNVWGLHDMHGNVWEWCLDWYDAGYYKVSPTDDPSGPSSASHRVFRGGCCWRAASDCRSAYRGYAPDGRNIGLGFRLAATPGELALLD